MTPATESVPVSVEVWAHEQRIALIAHVLRKPVRLVELALAHEFRKELTAA